MPPALIVLALALAACRSEPPPPAPEPEAVVAEEPHWKAVVVYDPDGDPAFRSHVQDIVRAAAKLDVYATYFAGPDGTRVPILADPQSDGTPEVVHQLDLSTFTTSRTGWILAEQGKVPVLQAAGSRAEFAAAATRYFGQDFVAALPWRVVVGIDRTEEGTFDLHLDRLAKAVSDADVHVVPWRKDDPTPIRFPSEGETVHTLDPTTMTQAQTGWLFAEEGRTPLYLPPGKETEVLRTAARYFRLGSRSGGAALFLRPDGAEALGARRVVRGGRNVRRGLRRAARQPVGDAEPSGAEGEE
ncbi:MAG: hypothetical protein JXB39_08990 [Deltaproteobacteria bacterium]|nr:hypothetical protein [Deltaproteobacteria bacterium]